MSLLQVIDDLKKAVFRNSGVTSSNSLLLNWIVEWNGMSMRDSCPAALETYTYTGSSHDA